MKRTKTLSIVLPILLGYMVSADSISIGAGEGVIFPSSLTHTIAFSGYNWTVKSGSGLGPGPNTWEEKNVWVDSNGWMHLKITYNATKQKWLCASVSSTIDFGHGIYQWKVHGPVSTLDKNVVVGLFHYTGPDGYNEIDIEFAQFGNDSSPNIHYSVYPAAGSSTKPQHFIREWKQCCGTSSTHRYTWTDEKVIFKSMNGYYDDDTNLFMTNTFSAPETSIPEINMPVKMNLWCFRGLAPSDGEEVEIILVEFKFSPLL